VNIFDSGLNLTQPGKSDPFASFTLICVEASLAAPAATPAEPSTAPPPAT